MTIRQPDRKTDTDRQPDTRQAVRQTDRQAVRKTDRQTTDSQTDR